MLLNPYISFGSGGGGGANPNAIDMVFEAANGSQIFLDTGNAASIWTAGGTTPADATISTALILSGTSSLRIINNDACILTPSVAANNLPATAPWLLKFRGNWSQNAGRDIIGCTNAVGNAGQFEIYVSSSLGSGNTTNPLLFYLDAGAGLIQVGTTNNLPQSITYDIEFERIANTIYVRVNGVQNSAVAFAGSIAQPAGLNIRLGQSAWGILGNPVYFDNFSLTK
jgi:hypothetical protein